MIPAFDDADESHAREVVNSALKARGEGWLTIDETRSVLDCFRIPQASGGVAKTAEDAVRIAEHLGLPVAAKLASHTLVHKTEIDAVRLNLNTAREVSEAFNAIAEGLRRRDQLNAMDGVFVQSMIRDAVELRVGVTDDPLFGPLIGFGLGGIHVEILGDVQFRITPLTEEDASEMVRGIKGYPLLTGYRGHQPVDVQAIEEVLLRISRLVEEIPEISELDLNPI